MKLKYYSYVFMFLFYIGAHAQYESRKLIKELDFKQASVKVNLKEFYDLTKVLPSGYVKDGSTNYTSHIQNAIDIHSKLVMPNFPICVSGVFLSSNSEIYFQENSLLVLEPTHRERYQVLALHNVENVVMYNAKVKGDLGKHIGSKGEWGFGIDIRNSKNIKLFNTTVYDCWGDGVIIAQGDKGIREDLHQKFSTENIFIEGLKVDNTRRNGISIINGNNIIIKDAVISNVFCIAPKAGIDIEPDNSNWLLDNIKLENIKMYNVGIGLDIHLVAFTSKKENKRVNINVNNIEVQNATTGIYLAGYEKIRDLKKINGKISISKFYTKNVLKPFTKRNQYGLYPVVRIQDFNFSDSKREYKNDIKILLKNVIDKNNLIIK